MFLKSFNQIILILFLSTNASAQTLINGELEGPASMTAVPDGWEMIPFTDPNCESENEAGATPDIYTIDGPAMVYGFYGNPHGGLSFSSGIYSTTHQEGIQQTVSEFSIGQEYKVSFWQALVKSEFGAMLDTSGSWAMYVDNTLIAVSTFSHSLVPAPIGGDLVWEYRSMSFIATDTMHTIKFLPVDDDPDQSSGAENLSGSVRMGIDDVFLVKGSSAGINDINTSDEPILIGIYDTLGRETKDIPNALLFYVYSDGTTKKVFRIE
ncbi:MAG: hypothetical protein GQ574_29450 [Crocinitomix sp.]|nr:hypothetical protein [Crocinitomix sp.]